MGILVAQSLLINALLSQDTRFALYNNVSECIDEGYTSTTRSCCARVVEHVVSEDCLFIELSWVYDATADLFILLLWRLFLSFASI